MAFVSQIHGKPGRPKAGPGVIFRETPSKSGGGYISKSVPLRGKKIDIQIDETKKLIRLTEYAAGVSVCNNGTFSCPRSTFQIVGRSRISLELNADGYWYGSYGEAS